MFNFDMKKYQGFVALAKILGLIAASIIAIGSLGIIADSPKTFLAWFGGALIGLAAGSYFHRYIL